MTGIIDVLKLGPVIPVLTIEDAAHAAPIAQALVHGGVRALEVTLRTPAALDAIRTMSKVAGACVGAGTVLTADAMHAAIDAGARFIVSPGLTPALAQAATAARMPLLPGAVTASEIMNALDQGFTHLKFFPAATSGGIAALKAFSGPFSSVRFCPTGGITAATAAEWLALPNVACVGGTWLTPPGPPDLAAIEGAARAAASLRNS